MMFAGFRRFRPGGLYRPLHIALSGPPYIESDLPPDLPILEDELKMLDSQILDLQFFIGEADHDE